MADKDRVKHQGWVASLSNGETVFEEEPVPGERTSWGKLKERCEEEEIWVTQIQLQRHGQNIVGIKGADGYTAFVDFRKEGLMGSEYREIRQFGIGSVVGNTVYCTVMNEEGQHWQDSRPLSNMRAHCILNPQVD